MQRPSFTVILSGLFIAYVAHSIYTIYTLFTPPVCTRADNCLKPYLLSEPKLMAAFYTSTKSSIKTASDVSLLWQWEDVNVSHSMDWRVNVTLPRSTLNNGSLYVHAFLMPKFQASQSASHMLSSPYSSYASASLTSFMIPEAEAFNLLGADKDSKKPVQSDKKLHSKAAVVSHWRQKLSFSILADPVWIPAKQVPGEIMKYITLTPTREYLPILYIDKFGARVRDLKQLQPTDSVVELAISYAPISYGKLRFYSQVEIALHTMGTLGFNEKDLDEIKGVFLDTNIYFLCLTFIIAALHMLFDFLAFKNDISFWRKRKNIVGLSSRSLMWRCGSHVVVFFYLMDEETSMLVLLPAGIGTIIEFWKLTKALKISVKFQNLIPKLEFGALSEEEKKTGVYDAQSMKYLSYLLYPLCVGGAVYSLLFTPHKGWYSWCIQSLVNGVYAFGFLFMLPQLFVNYKHKSVAHLPWRAFMYKAFNTFIDDIFAFIITMPTAHRVACFRDDVVFLVYLYQRWLYPVDKSRVNEFGESFEDEINKNERKSLKKRN